MRRRRQPAADEEVRPPARGLSALASTRPWASGVAGGGRRFGRVATSAVFGVGLALFAAAFLVPCAALGVRLIVEGQAPTDGWIISLRQWGLLARTLGLVLAATVMALLLAWPATVAWARGASGATMAGMAAILLTSPMVMCFAWQHLLRRTTPAAWPAMAGCVWVWAAWLWPVPAMIIGSAWRRCGRETFEDALTRCGPVRAFVSVGLPAVRGAVAAATVLVFTLLSAEYVVPHAWGLRVYATELLSWATSTGRTMDAVFPALPMALVLAAGLIGMAWFTRRAHLDLSMTGEGAPPWRGPWVSALTTVMIIAAFVFPVIGLAWRLGSLSMFSEVLMVHRTDLAGSLACCALAGVLGVLLALGLTCAPTAWRASGWLLIVFGAAPGALVGEAVLAAYGGWAATSDHWIMLVLGLTARFAWVAWLVAALAIRADRSLEEQAAVDGADDFSILLRVRVARHAALLIGAGLVIAAMSLSDLATTVQVQTSRFVPISLVLVDKMHKFEDACVLTISLLLAASACPGIAAVAWTLRRSR